VTLDPITGAALHREARKAALLDLVAGRQTRSETRPRSGGFDGGARQPVPTRRPPEQEHNQLVAQLAQLSRTFGTRF
jgi:hypothetical protein